MRKKKPNYQDTENVGINLFLLLKESKYECYRENNRKNQFQTNMGCFACSSLTSWLVLKLFGLVQNAEDEQSFSIPLLFYEQLPFSSLTSPPDLISFSEFSPEKKDKVANAPWKEIFTVPKIRTKWSRHCFSFSFPCSQNTQMWFSRTSSKDYHTTNQEAPKILFL